MAPDSVNETEHEDPGVLLGVPVEQCPDHPPDRSQPQEMTNESIGTRAECMQRMYLDDEFLYICVQGR
jgi:hypothetical protein